MTNFQDVYAALRRRNRKSYALLLFCDFISVLLITSYAAILRSPTVLNVLPEGGDSRRQTYMIFALAVIGCVAFTLYAAGLFLRGKSREMGVFLALGASKPLLRRTLYRELALLSLAACGAGAALGIPLAMGIWQLFRLFLVNTEEMVFHVGWETLLAAAAFSGVVILALFVQAARFIRRTNVMEILNEQHRSEMVRNIPRWCGPLGIVLSIIGGLCGYFAPSVIIIYFHYYPWGWEYLFYLPLLIGIYMILLHTVVNGWRKRDHYRHLVTHSMMKFQGRQTVNNMLVMTMLLAAAYFASFYTPIMMVSNSMGSDALRFDGLFHAPMDEHMLTEEEIRAAAAEEGVEIQSIKEAECVLLGLDGERHIEEGRHWHTEYEEVNDGMLFFSASGFEELTGERIALAPGELYTFLNTDGSEPVYGMSRNTTLLTNTFTGDTLRVTVIGALPCTEFASTALVMNDADYARLSQGLPDSYRERWLGLDFAGENEYAFARRLRESFLDGLSPDAFHSRTWNRIEKAIFDAKDGVYPIEEYEKEGGYSKEERNGFEFRQDGKYRPLLRVLEKNDALEQMAVFVTVFLYISVICYLSVVLIGHTRSRSVTLINQPVYEDLRRLGASRAYLRGTVRAQIMKIYGVPALVGTTVIYSFYILVLYANDGYLSSGEVMGLLVCAGVLAALGGVLWLCCRAALRAAYRVLAL